MFIWAPLARHAKYARLSRVILVFLAMQSLLALPVLFTFLRTPPNVFYPRIHGGPDFELFDQSWAPWIDIVEDEIGFIQEINLLPEMRLPMVFARDRADSPYLAEALPHQVVITSSYVGIPELGSYPLFMFVITPEYFFYHDSNALLAVPVERVPGWVLRDMNLPELFNHLALYNRYFSSIVMPVYLLIFLVFLLSQFVICVAAIWLFGQWRKLSGTMTVRERFSVLSFASVPAGLAGMLIGFVVPIAHVFIFQLLMIYIAYKAMKEF